MLRAGLDTVDELDVAAYLGRWYTVYEDKASILLTSADYCVTADYGLFSSTNISVYNAGRVGSASAPLTDISGFAVVPDASEPGKLVVSLGGVPVPAPYWVVALGPLNSASLYSYAVVTDNLGLGLFVLVRDVDEYFEKYDDDVQDLLQSLGFTTALNTPVAIPQDGCEYPPEPSLTAGAPAVGTTNLPTVTELDVNAYVGTWYEVYQSRVAQLTTVDNYCVTAQYGVISATNVSVLNEGRLDDVSAQLDSITGYAYIPDTSEPGQLVVHLEGAGDAPYWIILLGPINDGGLYDYAVVSDPTGLFLFVLTRNVEQWYAEYDADVLAQLADLGFTTYLNEPIQVVQEGCVYP